MGVWTLFVSVGRYRPARKVTHLPKDNSADEIRTISIFCVSVLGRGNCVDCCRRYSTFQNRWHPRCVPGKQPRDGSHHGGRFGISHLHNLLLRLLRCHSGRFFPSTSWTLSQSFIFRITRKVNVWSPCMRWCCLSSWFFKSYWLSMPSCTLRNWQPLHEMASELCGQIVPKWRLQKPSMEFNKASNAAVIQVLLIGHLQFPTHAALVTSHAVKALLFPTDVVKSYSIWSKDLDYSLHGKIWWLSCMTES